MTKPNHMKPPGRPVRHRGPDLNFRNQVNFDGMTPASTHARDVANFDLILALGKMGCPIKPPKRRKP